MKTVFPKLFKTMFLFAALLFCAGAFAFAQEPAVSAQLDKNEASVGDVIKLTVNAQLPENAYLAVNDKIIFNNFDTLKTESHPVAGVSGAYVITFNIAAYATGVLNIEPVGISYINASGAKRMFFTPAMKVRVKSVLDENPKDIKDIKPLVKMNVRPVYLAAIVLIVIFIAVLCVLAAKSITAAKNNNAAPLDPQRKALILLDRLAESGVMKNEEPRVFYYKAAEILRTYIYAKYEFNAMEMTSTELIKKLEDIVHISMTREELRKYIGVFDLARYAGFKPSQQSMMESLEKTKEFIRKL